MLDQHEDDVTDASLRLQRLIAAKPSVVDASSERAMSRKLARCLKATGTDQGRPSRLAVGAVPGTDERCQEGHL